MKFKTHTVSQSEVIGNFTLFSKFSHLFFTPFPYFFHGSSQLITPYLHMKFQTHTASQSEVIGNFTPFPPIFTPFFHTFSKMFFTGHRNSSPPIYIWNFRIIPSVNQKLLAISHLFAQFSHLFFTPFPKCFSRVTTTHHPLPTYEISDSYHKSIRSYWQFHTFFPNFHNFFSHLFQFFFSDHHNSSPLPTYEISDSFR